MKVHQILEAGPRREPSLGALTPTASATPTPTSVDIRRSQVLGPDGRPFFTVVDQDGNELFRGTEEQANVKRDEIQRRIRPAAAATRTQAAPDADRPSLRAEPADDTRARTRTPAPTRGPSLSQGLSKAGILEFFKKYGMTAIGGGIINIGLKIWQLGEIANKLNEYDTVHDDILRLVDRLEDRNTSGAEMRTINAEIRQLTARGANITKEIVDETTDYFFTAVGMGILVTGAAAGAGFVGAGWIVSLILGAAAAMGGAAGGLYLGKQLPASIAFSAYEGKDASLYDAVHDIIANVASRNIAARAEQNPGLLQMILASEQYPAWLNLQAIQLPAIPLGGLSVAGAAKDAFDRVVGDSITYEAEEEETTDNSAKELKQLILNDPKLKKLAIIGKAELKSKQREEAATS